MAPGPGPTGARSRISNAAGGAGLRLARSRSGGALAWAALTLAARAAPGRFAAVDDAALAFHHPSTKLAVHYLVVPRRRVADFLTASSGTVQAALDLARVVHRARFADEPLLVTTNLGRHQDVRLLHFHAVVDARGDADGAARASRADLSDVAPLQERAAAVLERTGACRVRFRPLSDGGWSVAFEE